MNGSVMAPEVSGSVPYRSPPDSQACTPKR
jgi:hypothetical protein